jgi:hypothetical protein
MTVAETWYKRLVYRFTAFDDKRGSKTRRETFFCSCRPVFSRWRAVRLGSAQENGQGGVNRALRTARTCRSGINLNRADTIGGTSRYGMFTQ